MTVLLPFMHLTPVEDFIRVTGKENDLEKKGKERKTEYQSLITEPSSASHVREHLCNWPLVAVSCTGVMFCTTI